MSLELSKDQINGDNSEEMEVDVPAAKVLQFDPLPQRVPRLNRRGFYMSGRDKQAKSEQEKVNSQKVSVSNRSSIKSETTSEEKISTPLSNRIIKLNITKKSPNNETEKCLKRNVNGNDQLTHNNESSQEPPPKKKHKPITWP